MGGLHFDISADNSNFIQRLNEIKSGVKSASNTIQDLSKNFDVSTVENKVITLNKVIRDNEASILQLTKQMQKWSIDAKEAFNNNDISTFNTITKDIEEQSLKIAELTKETKQYYDALAMVESSGGATVSISAEPTSSPQFFKTQQDYEYAEMLKAKIAQLQEQIAGFDGSDEDLQPLRSSLSDLQDKLRGCELEAAKAASELGENLGAKAAEASESLYQLNASVEKQQMVVQSLSVAVQNAASSLNSIKEGGDLTAIDDAQIKYDALSYSLQNAQMELANLQAAQIDAKSSFQSINQEIELHDSLMVKMLGGYENYQNIIGQLPTPIQGVVGSINGMTGAAKAFIATPLGAAIGAIVLVLQTLKTWFDSSVEGQLAFAEISGYVSGVLDQLKEIVITVGKAIYNAFSNPKKAVVDLWNAIKTNIVNRFKAVGDIAVGLGKVIENAFSGKFDEAGKELSQLKDKYVQLATGVENATGKIKKYVKGVNDAAKANAQLNKEEKLIEIDASKEGIESSKRNKRMQELSAEMYNTSASAAKRKAALAEYKKLSEEQMNAELKLQDRRIALQEKRMSLTTNAIEDENKLRELQKQRVDIEAQNASRMAMLQRRSNRIEGSGKTSGPTAAQLESKQDSSHQKLLDLMKQQAEERLMLQQEYEMELWQNRINLMEDGEAKVLEQMKLDQTKEKYSLEERKKQAIQSEIQRQKAVFDAREDEKAAGNKKYAKQVFNPGEDIAKTVEKLSGIDDAIIKAQEELDKLIETEGSQEEIGKCKQRLKDLTEEHKKFSSKMGDVTDTEVRTILERYKALYEDLGKMQEKSYDDRIKNAEDSLNQYLAKYGSYEQKRYAIAKEWDEKIEQATAAERPMLEAEKDAAMSDLDFEEWKNSGEIAKAFGDIKKLSSSTVKELIRHMEQYRGKIIETFDPEKIREYNEALEELKRADIDESLGIFSSFVPEPFKEAAEQEKMMVEYEKQYVELKEKAAALQSDIMANQADVVQLGKQKGVDISFDDIMGEDAFANVAAKFKEAGVEMGAEMESSLSSLVGKMGQMGNMQGMMGQLSGMMSGGGGGGGMMGNLNAVGAIVHGINDNVQSLKELFDDLSNTADALGADTSVGSNWAQAGIIMDGFAEASQGATDAFDSLKSGNVMGVIQGIVKSFTSWIRAFAAFNDAKHERKILELQDRIDDLKESYEDLGKTVDDYFSIDAADILEKQNELIRQQNALVRQQMQEEEAKKNTDDEKMEEYRKQLKANEDLLKENEKKAKEAIIGKDIKSAIDEFASLYAEAWDDGTDAAQKSMKAVKSIITSALNELLNKRLQPAAQKFYDKLAEMLKKGYLTDSDLSYLDSLKAEMDALAAKEEEQYKKIQERYKDLDELREELTDISFDSVRDNFKSLLTDMESSTEDFADNFSEMLRNALVEGLMDSKYDALLKEWYAAFAEAMDDQKLTDEERERLRQQYDAIVQQGIADRNAINDIVGGGAYSQQASKGEAWGMNQETGEELNGRFTAMVELEATNNVLVADGNAIAREILIAVRSMTGMSMTTSGSDNKDTLLAIKDMVFLSTGYLEDIAKYSKSLVEINTEIVNIKNHIKDL